MLIDVYYLHPLCVCSHVYIPAHVSACIHVCGMQHKVLVCASRHKTSPHPPLPFPWGGGGEKRQSVYLPVPCRGVGVVAGMGGCGGGGVGTV